MGYEAPESKATIKCRDTGVNLRVYFETLTRHSKWRTSTAPYIIPDGSTAVLKIVKADNTFVVVDAKNVERDNVYFEPHPQAFTVAGKASAEVSLYGPDGRRVTSQTFHLEISPECDSNSTEDSESYVDIMAEQINGIKDATVRSEEAATRSETAAARAEEAAKRAEESGGGGGASEADIYAAVDKYMQEHPVHATADAELSDTSENAVQNKVVTAKFGEVETTIGNIDVLLGTI